MDNDDDILNTLGNITIGTDDYLDSSITLGNISIDPSMYGGGTYTIASSAVLPTITLSGGGTYAIGSAGTGGSMWTSASNGPIWTTNQTQASLKVSGNAEIEGDLKIAGRSILESLERIEKHLGILVPDPARLEKYEALKQAWEHYKTLEALCVEQDDDPDQG
jgi:hypothetical protein